MPGYRCSFFGYTCVTCDTKRVDKLWTTRGWFTLVWTNEAVLQCPKCLCTSLVEELERRQFFGKPPDV